MAFTGRSGLTAVTLPGVGPWYGWGYRHGWYGVTDIAVGMDIAVVTDTVVVTVDAACYVGGGRGRLCSAVDAAAMLAADAVAMSAAGVAAIAAAGMVAGGGGGHVTRWWDSAAAPPLIWAAAADTAVVDTANR